MALLPPVPGPCTHAVITICGLSIGATAEKIKTALRAAGFTDVTPCGSDFNLAIETCRKLAQPGWTVLFSPACASFDMFSDYEARGRIFKELVNKLN